MTATVTRISAALRDAFLECHAEGHQWRHEGRIGGSDPGARPPFQQYDSVGRVSICTSCTSERVRWYTRSGEVVNRYNYAEGYLHRKATPDDEPAPTRLEWRRRLVVTLFDDTPRKRRRRKAAS